MTALAFSRRRIAIAAALSVLAAVAVAVALPELPILWSRVVSYALAMQRELHRGLATAMRAVQQAEARAFWSLVGLGFLYGVFHAVGPGHGKVVISTYLATHESRLRRGIALSVLSSLLQGATAILVVCATVAVLQRSMREAQSAAITLETLSYGLVAMLGLYLALRSGRRLFEYARAHDHGHDQSAAVDRAAQCAHAHGPTAADVSTPPSLRHFLITVLSVGVRPCSGAILVLVLAYAMNLVWAGVAAVMAMSAGTALTVSAMAALSVYARKSAVALGGYLSEDSTRFAQVLDAIGMLGGILIVLFGMALLQASLVTAKHPLL